MSSTTVRLTADLPEVVARTLDEFVAACSEAFGDDLRAVVLYGSAAEARLRPTSDVNVIVVLAAFDGGRAERLGGPLRLARAAVRLSPMFLLESEIAAASEAFAAKFADVLRRRRVLLGADPFADVAIPRTAETARLKQTLLNLSLRLRAAYAGQAAEPDRLALTVADAAGPLRAAAALLLELEGRPAASPKDALARVAAEGGFDAVSPRLSEARETGALPPGAAAPAVLRLAELAAAMRTRAEALRA